MFNENIGPEIQEESDFEPDYNTLDVRVGFTLLELRSATQVLEEISKENGFDFSDIMAQLKEAVEKVHEAFEAIEF